MGGNGKKMASDGGRRVEPVCGNGKKMASDGGKRVEAGADGIKMASDGRMKSGDWCW